MNRFPTRSSDTDAAAEELQFEIWGRMSAQEKVVLTFQLCEFARQLALQGLRERHPQASERELVLRLAAQNLDRETMIRAFGFDPEDA